jgi:hypothetical protein
MNKIQTIFALFILMTIIISMGIAFGNPIYENFYGGGVVGGLGSKYFGIGRYGYNLDYVINTNIPGGTKYGNMRYPGRNYLSTVSGPIPKKNHRNSNSFFTSSNNETSDDAPSYFSY